VIEESATVISCEGRFAEVETQRRSACGECSAGVGCGSAVIAKWFGDRRARLRVCNDIDARPGNQVVIGVREKTLVAASLLVYLLPLVLLLLGAIGASELAARSALPVDPIAALGGIGGLLLGLLAVRRLAGSITENHQAKILRQDWQSVALNPIPQPTPLSPSRDQQQRGEKPGSYPGSQNP